MSRWLFFPSQKCGWNLWDKIKQKKNFARDSKVIEKNLSKSKKIETFSRHALNVKILLRFNFTEGKFKIWLRMLGKFSMWNLQILRYFISFSCSSRVFFRNFKNKTWRTILTSNLKFAQIIFVGMLMKEIMKIMLFLMKSMQWSFSEFQKKKVLKL